MPLIEGIYNVLPDQAKTIEGVIRTPAGEVLDPQQYRNYFSSLEKSGASYENAAAEVRANIRTFLNEYLTGSIEVNYQLPRDAETGTVYMDQNGLVEFVSSYKKTVEFFLEQKNYKQARLAIAELESFQQIQEHLVNSQEGSAILRSPDRGCGYSYVSHYSVDPETKNLQIQMYRIYSPSIENQMGARTFAYSEDATNPHDNLRKNLNLAGVQAIESKRPNPILERYTREAESILQQNSKSYEGDGLVAQIAEIEEITRILSQPILSTERIDPLLILQSYLGGDHYSTVTELMRIRDGEIAEIMHSFEGEIDAMCAEICNVPICDSSTREFPDGGCFAQNYDENLQQAYNAFLLKAIVHFSPDVAEELLGSDMVSIIKSMVNSAVGEEDPGFDYNMNSMDKRLYHQGILNNLEIDMKLVFKGSCDSDDVGKKLGARTLIHLALAMLRDPFALMHPDKYIYECTCGYINGIDTGSGDFITKDNPCEVCCGFPQEC